MLATLAPRGQRRACARAIVALELLFDYLDGRTEMPVDGDPLEARRTLFAPMLAAIGSGRAEPETADRQGDEEYVWALAATVQRALGERALAVPARRQLRIACERAIEAQVRLHAAGEAGADQAREWASANVNGAGLDWREYLAGASASVVAMHALIAIGSGPAEEAGAIDELYLRLAALASLLDAALDHGEDGRGDVHSCADLFADGEALAEAVCELAAQACSRAGDLANSRGHRMILGGLLAFYTTAPGSGGTFAAPSVHALTSAHQPLLAVTGPYMRWRRDRDGTDER
jgi:hypothetical protein